MKIPAITYRLEFQHEHEYEHEYNILFAVRAVFAAECVTRDS